MSPIKDLDGFLDKFEPEIAARARRVLKEVRKRAKGAVELVYDNYNALAIGFGPTEKTSEAVISIAVWPRSVMLYFLKGAALADPAKRLKGAGARGRHIPDVDAASFSDPAVEDLIARALAAAEPPFDPRAKVRTIIKSVSAKQRPRRPAAKAAYATKSAKAAYATKSAKAAYATKSAKAGSARSRTRKK